MKTPRLTKSGIEYLDYAWNFYSGCLNMESGICRVGKDCWARGITTRFPNHYPTGFKPTFYPEAFLSPLYLRKPSRIGVAFMGDLFGDWVDPAYEPFYDWKLLPGGHELKKFDVRSIIYYVIERCPQHTFVFLTKCPGNYMKWSPFPSNCQIGATATSHDAFIKGLVALRKVEAKVKFFSFEPVLEQLSVSSIILRGIGQIIIGAQTKPYKPPKIEWVQEIVDAADKAGIPVFLKDNMEKLLVQKKDGQKFAPLWANGGYGKLRQELPV